MLEIELPPFANLMSNYPICVASLLTYEVICSLIVFQNSFPNTEMSCEMKLTTARMKTNSDWECLPWICYLRMIQKVLMKILVPISFFSLFQWIVGNIWHHEGNEETEQPT